jgi:hypothetical protein
LSIGLLAPAIALGASVKANMAHEESQSQPLEGKLTEPSVVEKMEIDGPVDEAVNG